MKEALTLLFSLIYGTLLFCEGSGISHKFHRKDPRIVGGNYATDGLVPYVVAIQSITGGWICGGSIIAPNWILTAAHCFTRPPNKMRIIAGIVNQHTPSESNVYLVKETIAHCLYNKPKYHNDIGLIRLTKPIEFNEHTQPIKLARKNVLKEGDKLNVSGWGSNGYLKYYDKSLKTAEVSYTDCYKDNKFAHLIGEGHICTATTSGNGVCDKDSGGPLAYKNKTLYGVVNAAVNCAVGYPDVFASVAYYYNWILNTMNGDRACKK